MNNSSFQLIFREVLMSLPDRNNPYSFDDFLTWRQSVDYYADDPFIQKVLRHYTGDQWEKADKAARALSLKASFRWREFAEVIAWPEKRPYVMHYDGHHHRIDRIVRPAETEIMETEVFSEALFSARTSPWVRLIKMYLVYQNGEACIACPITCTEGLVAILEKYADSPETKHILRHCKEGIEGDFAIGAQYLSEIQGGSDVPANVLEAVREGDDWKLYGTKFFCSATHADYAVVTAKPAGSEEIALFVVPSWLPGDKAKEIRNGCTIDRIKWKLGTSELTTAEITYHGAVAYPVGPLARGLANVVGVVLTCSRLTVGLSCAAFMARAVREARKYAEFRGAFGFMVGQFPMVMGQMRSMETSARRTIAAAFKLYSEFLKPEGGLQGGMTKDGPEATKKKQFEIRELIMLQKITASWDATDVIRAAMSVFGGHGVMEDFSCLPRLYRDAAVNELWEGPRNVLLTQMHRDFQRASTWYNPGEFVENILKNADFDIIAELKAEITELVAYPNLFQPDDKTMMICERWDFFCQRLYHAYQNQALKEVEG
jgi:alkylation response protein AidB-like acyl-CoA dehydrogenase